MKIKISDDQSKLIDTSLSMMQFMTHNLSILDSIQSSFERSLSCELMNSIDLLFDHGFDCLNSISPNSHGLANTLMSDYIAPRPPFDHIRVDLYDEVWPQLLINHTYNEFNQFEIKLQTKTNLVLSDPIMNIGNSKQVLKYYVFIYFIS